MKSDSRAVSLRFWPVTAELTSYGQLPCVYLTTHYVLTAGALGVPVHWSMKSDSRAVSLRFGPATAGSGVDAPWSHPIEASFPGGVESHVAIPVQPPSPSETAKPGAFCVFVLVLVMICLLCLLLSSL